MHNLQLIVEFNLEYIYFNMIKRLFSAATALLFTSVLMAQQLPNASFEDWSGTAFDGEIQPKSWNASNITQFSFKFNFAHREAGHTGSYSMMVQDQSVGAAGIEETSPGYFSLGQPWAYVPSLTEVNKATAGTSGGIEWKYRPDSMQVWVKRTGSNTNNEDFHLLYYAWNGTAKGSTYKGKNGGCTSYSQTNEESDIRKALNGNECQTSQFANQVAEGWHRARAQYNDWTCITVPIYYFNDEAPTMCNVIFSASNYPNFRANSGLYVGNSLYVDDVKMIYSSKIQKLFIGNKEWKGFDPNNTEEQVYSVGNNPTIPDIYAMRGSGTLTNTRNESVTFYGRRLTDKEITIQKGAIDGEPTIITVKSEDGSSTTTYKIKFISKPSDNARLAGVQVNGEPLAGYNGYVGSYNVALPYGTTAAPVVTFDKAEEAQVVTITQATSPTGKAVINVTAADGKTKMTYTLNFSVALLSDNTLKDILIDGESLPGFKPEYTTYNRVELPLGTTTVPDIQAVSAYPKGAQTIVHTAPNVIDGGQYQIAVSTPGNPTPRVYKLNFKITASTNTHLKDLRVGNYITNFSPDQTTYYVNLPLGTTSLPEITYEKGDKWQTVTIESEGIDGTTRVIVTAASGDQLVYKIVFSTLKSSVTHLNNIYLDGKPLAGFNKEVFAYSYELPIGTTTLPVITYDKGDEYQTVTVRTDGLNGTTRITVTAGDGSTALYQIKFSLLKANNANLKMIYVDGVALADFVPTRLEYTVNLPQGTTTVPTITWEAGDEWQTITYRAATSLTGESKITVRPQEGSSQTYIIRFAVHTSANTNLLAILLDGVALEGFSPDKLEYEITLPEGVSTIPVITFEKAEAVQRVIALQDGTRYILRVMAENGTTKEYILNFIIQKSENAFLKMIYLDGVALEGFDSQKLSGYVVELSGTTCPMITVDKEAGQQVSIMAPAGAGEAIITVQPEAGAPNTYIIEFKKAVAAEVQLKNILLNGVSLTGFAPNKYLYDNVSYAQALPTITYETANATQKVTVLRDKETITVLVVDGAQSNTYTLHFVREYNADAGLKTILLNGAPLSGFEATTLHYTVPVAAGAILPLVTYEKNTPTQTVVAGAISETEYQLHVTAENGATNTYKLTFTLAPYTDATLQNLLLDGVTIAGFEPNKTEYSIELEEGVSLPTLTYLKREGQSILLAQTTPEQQQVIVVAENGDQLTYTVNYTHKRSSNALLHDILVDGVSLKGFSSTIYDYVDTLAWRTRVVPVLNPIAGNPGQTITTYYSAINGTTKIHVMAADGETTADYTIAFPVVKSSNTLLDNVMCEEELEFVATTNDYVVTLPYGKNVAPLLTYTAQEVEQTVQYIAAPLGDTTKIIVTAENGDERVYRFFFKQTLSDKPNRLQSILVNGIPIDMSLATEVDAENIAVNVPMPYGTTTFNVACVANYAEQTYFLQPGGTKRPTIITLYPNRGDEKAVTYTITPQIDMQNPAYLTGISVNGTPIADFDKNRFTYIVNLDNANSMPNFGYTPALGATTDYPKQQNRSWEITVHAGGYSNTYRVIYHYPNDIIPNADFLNWGKAATRTSEDKPISWQVAADYANKITVFWVDAYVGPEVANAGNGIVKMTTTYWSTAGGAIPSIMTLGKMNVGLSVSNKTTSDFYDYIPFHNTPDSVVFRYNNVTSKGNGPRFAFRFNNNSVEHAFDYAPGVESTTNGYVTYTHPLATSTLTNVQGMNIAVNATDQTSGCTAGAELYVDWFRFIYNSKLASITIGNDNPITPSGNTFAYALDDPELSTKPDLTFVGEVSDQTRKIEWGEETKDGDKAKRVATITNYAEDGTSTVYTLTVTRPLSQQNKLTGLEVGGISIFDKEQTDYTINLSATDKLPNVLPTAATDLQDVKMAYAGNKMTITVTPEYGEATVYTINFVRTKSDDTTLKSLTATGITFDAATRDYTLVADALPAITFEKNHPNQKVDLDKGILTVTAEDGTVGTYTITLTPAVKTTSGLIKMLALNGLDMQEWDTNTFDYTKARPNTTSFVREYEQDSVIHTITPVKMSWHVMGTEEHTYTITYPTILSSDVDLADIILNGGSLPNFLKLQSDYTVKTDDPIELAIPAQTTQSYEISYADSVFTIGVTAEDSTPRAEAYTVQILPNLSSIASLQMIYLDGVALSGFHADTLKYAVELPCANPKTSEPQLPNITYDLGQESQHVQVEVAALGGTNYLTVTSEDGSNVQTYELTITAEPSHNVTLNNILVNGVQVKGFEPERYWYSAQTQADYVYLQYSSDDAFQTVVEKRGADGEYILEVTAQDGVTKKSYFVELWNQTQSNNAYLQNILIDGKPFSEYDPTCIDFSSKQLRYSIRVPESSVLLPDIYVALQEEGQTWQKLSGVDIDTIRVTAPDGVTTNDYILTFLRVKSSNVNLQSILLNGEPLADFDPAQTIYPINLPVGTRNLPMVDALKGDNTQQITVTTDETTTHISVTAEDGTQRSYWLIFTILLSEADTLQMLYEDGIAMADFVPTTFYYAKTLPVGTRIVPELGYDMADQWQTITVDTIVAGLQTTYQLHVQAESGKRNTYTVVYTLQQSSVDTLQMIYLDNIEFADFVATQNEYTLLLSDDATIPTIAWQTGDAYQTVDTLTVGNTISLTVHAENGNQRIYKLTFEKALSANADLKMIQVAGKDIANFDGGVLDYNNLTLPYGTTTVPAITFTKEEEKQNVTVSITDWSASIVVVAEDGVTTQTYTLNFTVERSDNAFLQMILLDGEWLVGFDAQVTEYDITLPFGTETLPVVTWLEADNQQMVESLVDEANNTVTLTVTSGNEDKMEYTVRFHIEQSAINTLEDLLLQGKTIEGFKPETNEYYITFEPNTLESELYTVEDITYTLTDTTATVAVTAQDAYTLMVVVTAANGSMNAYIIHQEIRLPYNALLNDLQIVVGGDSITIEGFDPEIFEYEYLVLAGDPIPTVAAKAQDSLAMVSISREEIDSMYIYTILCTAQDGTTEYEYTVSVHYSDLNIVASATSQDVLLKHIPGTNQYIAATTRQSVQILIMNLAGQKMLLQDVPMCDPNAVNVTTDANGNELLTDVDINSPGAIITIEHFNTPMFYVFLQNEKKRIATGKIMLTR